MSLEIRIWNFAQWMRLTQYGEWAKCYRTRINALVTVANFADLSKYPGHFHELVGNRKGQWACDLDQPYRLIIWGAEPNKAVIWAEVTEAEVVEIVDYHK